MTIAENLQRILASKNDILTALREKGITVPQSTKIDDVPSLITASTIATQPVSTDISKSHNLITRFAIFSDIHLSSPETNPETYTTNYGYRYGGICVNYLESIKSTLDFVAFNGDCLLESNNASDTVFGALSPIFDGYRTQLGTVPLYMIPGNHDMGTTASTWNNITKSANWSGVTFLDGSTTCFYKEINGDLYIWFGVLNSPAFNYTSAMYTWLFDLLQANANRERIFLFTHWFDGTVDEFGWRYYPAEYYNNGWATTDASHETRGPFGQIKNYKNVIWFSGHSHSEWEGENDHPNMKIHSNNTAKMVSVPAVYRSGEFAIVEVYDNMVVILPYIRQSNTVTRLQSKTFYIMCGGGATAGTYTIVRNLTGVTSSNASSTVASGSSYTTTLSLASGYSNMSVTVTMGGTDITSTAYSNGVVTINNVTGNIVITATATQVVTYTITYNLTNVSSSNNATTITAGSSFATTLTATNGYNTMHISVYQGSSQIHEGDHGSSEGVTIHEVVGNIVINATAPIPTEPSWDTPDSTYPTYVKCIYDVTSTSEPTYILASAAEGASDYSLQYITNMIVDGEQTTPALSHTFATAGKHEVLFQLNNNQFHSKIFYKVPRLWSVYVPSNIINTSETSFKSCPNLTKARFDMTLSNAITNNFIDKCQNLEVVKFGPNVIGLNGGNLLCENMNSLQDIYIEGDTFAMTGTNVCGSTSNPNYTVHVKSAFDQSTISDKFPGGTIVADL